VNLRRLINRAKRAQRKRKGKRQDRSARGGVWRGRLGKKKKRAGSNQDSQAVFSGVREKGLDLSA